MLKIKHNGTTIVATANQIRCTSPATVEQYAELKKNLDAAGNTYQADGSIHNRLEPQPKWTKISLPLLDAAINLPYITPSEAWSRLPTGVGFRADEENWSIAYDQPTGVMKAICNLSLEACGAILYASQVEAEDAIRAYDVYAATKPHPLKSMCTVDVDKSHGTFYPVLIDNNVIIAAGTSTYLLGSFCMSDIEAEAFAEVLNNIIGEG